MNAASLLGYSAALMVAVATPGPATFAIVSTGVARGARMALAFGAGVSLGDVLLTSLALLGLAALAATFGWMFAVVKYGGAAYLIWLGIKMWRTAPQIAEGPKRAGEGWLRTFGLGTAMAIGNPKAILFHASLMPLLLDMNALTGLDAIVILSIVLTVNLATMSVYAMLAGGASRWFQTPSRARWINRVAGSLLVGTGAVIASR